jgi:hypothetical protein
LLSCLLALSFCPLSSVFHALSVERASLSCL